MKPLAWMDIDHDWDVISAHHKTKWATGAYGSKNLERYSRPLYASAPDLLEALKAARHALVTSDNYRFTDLTVEQFDAHLNNGVPRDRLEFMTDFSAELAIIDAAIARATGEAA